MSEKIISQIITTVGPLLGAFLGVITTLIITKRQIKSQIVDAAKRKQIEDFGNAIAEFISLFETCFIFTEKDDKELKGVRKEIEGMHLQEAKVKLYLYGNGPDNIHKDIVDTISKLIGLLVDENLPTEEELKQREALLSRLVALSQHKIQREWEDLKENI